MSLRRVLEDLAWQVADSTRILRAAEVDDEDTSSSSFYSHHSKYYPREGNSTITTSVTIRVTPEHFYLASWSILWAGFLLGIALAAYQVKLELDSFKAIANKSPTTTDSPATGRIATPPPRGDAEAQVGDGVEGISAADWTRSRFRRLLLLAMTTRTILIPVQVWSSSLWPQIIADTLPEMAFAPAWSLLVSFFVQLVGVALGMGSQSESSTAMLVVQGSAFFVYGVLIFGFLWNPVAAILLYAFLCCIYAALFGTTLYFCPRLLALLYPSLMNRQHSGLAIRLGACCLLCCVMFGCRTFGFARKVVAPTQHIMSWWWNSFLPYYFSS